MSNAAVANTRLQWELNGVGLENLVLTERSVPRPGPEELLVRVDACGICFSDVKILNLGENHPRLRGRDLRRDPVVMGHETAMTVVEVGSERRAQFSPGQRFLIQADVYYRGEGLAFGYLLPGGYTQYQVIGREIIDGDEGCYLLPIGDGVSHAQAALCEPWACVEAAYRYTPRRGPCPDGRTLLLVLDPHTMPETRDELSQVRQVTALTVSAHPWLRDPGAAAHELAALSEAHPGGFDDILVYGMPNAVLAREAARLLRPGGVFSIQGAGGTGRVSLDIGSVHYRNQWYTGRVAGDSYRWDRTAELTPGGTAWFIGAGGPLGQMHLQRALTLPHPPARILVSQNGGARLEDLRQRYAAMAAARGVEFVLLDARTLGDDIYHHVRAATGGRGCDDICVIVPNADVVARAFDLLATGGGMDVFAGLAVGTCAELELGRVATDGVRLWGTSGSSVADLRQIVGRLESGALATDRVVAAVGGIETVREGLAAVREGIFLGKTLVYPHCCNLPLLTLPELAERHPTLAERLSEGRYWNPQAEAELLRLYEA